MSTLHEAIVKTYNDNIFNVIRKFRNVNGLELKDFEKYQTVEPLDISRLSLKDLKNFDKKKRYVYHYPGKGIIYSVILCIAILFAFSLFGVNDFINYVSNGTTPVYVVAVVNIAYFGIVTLLFSIATYIKSKKVNFYKQYYSANLSKNESTFVKKCVCVNDSSKEYAFLCFKNVSLFMKIEKNSKTGKNDLLIMKTN